jgi:diguanylate cyclase (GGDEF)-like protein
MASAFLSDPQAREIWRENMTNIGTGLFSALVILVLFVLYLDLGSLRSAALQQTTLISKTIAVSLEGNDLETIKARLLELSDNPVIEDIVVYNRQTHALVDWSRQNQFEAKVSLPDSGLINEPQSTLTINRLKIATPVFRGDDLVGKIYLETNLRALYLQILLIFMAGAVLTGGIAVACANKLTALQLRRLAPLAELTDVAEQIATLGDYSLRVRLNETYIFKTLMVHFNQIMEAIETWDYDRKGRAEEIEDTKRRLEILATHDSLTQLPNRKYFDYLINRCVADATEDGQLTALMFIDLDNFKSFNEQFGCDAGDLILTTIANRLSAVLRNTDTLCRVDGDEFAAILPQVESEEMALLLAERLINSINRPMRLRGRQIVVSGNIGIACRPAQDKGQRLFLRNTDQALKQAKARGKNSCLMFMPQKTAAASD